MIMCLARIDKRAKADVYTLVLLVTGP